MMENAKCTLGTVGVMGSDQVPVSKSSKVLLSPIRGGCGCVIPYSEGHGQLTSEYGPIWCGMESKSVENHYFICAECQGS
jgi:hypothetical protein